MRAVAVETSGRTGSIAIVQNRHVVDEMQFPHGLKHAAEIVPIIDRLCSARGWTARDLNELYVSAGPGSFTGLRIGITLAKMLAFATGAKLVAVPSVRVLAENAPPEAMHVIIVLDAKRDQVFTARFERNGGVWHEREPAHLDSLARMIERAPRPLYLVGEGIACHRKFIPESPDIVVTDEACWRAKASVVAEIGMEMGARGEFTEPDRLVPIYIRPPEAQEKYRPA